jgi:hypothetical protein
MVAYLSGRKEDVLSGRCHNAPKKRGVALLILNVRVRYGQLLFITSLFVVIALARRVTLHSGVGQFA